MGVIDITGVICEDMWNYEKPFPKFEIRPLGHVPWAGCEVHCEVFVGIHSQTGTYLETPAHFYGNDKSYLVSDIPVENLINIPCTIINLDPMLFEASTQRKAITAPMLEECVGGSEVPEQNAVLIGTGWGKHWTDKCYLESSPFFTYDAMIWLMSKRPYLIGTDFPRWENLEKPQGFFEKFYDENILMLAPCVDIEKITSIQVNLTVLPLKIHGTSSVPCRAIIVEE